MTRAEQDNQATTDEELLRSMTENLVDELDPEEVILFGSRAGGTESACSDVDLLVILSDSEEPRHHLRRLTGRAYRRLAGYPVAKDILVYSRSETERWRHVQGHVIAWSLEKGRQLYSRSRGGNQ